MGQARDFCDGPADDSPAPFELAAARPVGTPVALYGPPGSPHGSGQAWPWSPDGDVVDITLFVLEEAGSSGWRASAHEATYRALRRDVLTSALPATGFASVEWPDPSESGYHQPVVVAGPV